MNKYLQPKTKIYRYTIEKKISSGGFGIVYLAYRDDGMPVAIKEYMPSFIKQRKDNDEIVFQNKKEKRIFEKGVDSFYQEADTIAQINSSYIVSILDVFSAKNTAYFVMPFEMGDTLNKLRKNHPGFLTYQNIKQYFANVCKGIQELHNNKVLHLDIKPSNILIRPDEQALIIDLGTSKTKAQLLEAGISARTVGFTAPEQHGKKNYKYISTRTDVYSICASILSLLIRKAPKPSIERVNETPYVQQYAGIFPYELMAIIDRGMSLKPNERFQSAEELGHVLSQSTLNDSNFAETHHIPYFD